MLSVLSLILITVYLRYKGKNYFITLIPGLILFYINLVYLFSDKTIGFGMEGQIVHLLAVVIALFLTFLLLKYSKY